MSDLSQFGILPVLSPRNFIAIIQNCPKVIHPSSKIWSGLFSVFRSVVRHYDLQSYTRTGDKWNIPTRGSGNSNSGTATPMAAGGGGGSSQRQFGTEDHRLGFLPIGPEVHDDVRSRKDDHPFLQVRIQKFPRILRTLLM